MSEIGQSCDRAGERGREEREGEGGKLLEEKVKGNKGNKDERARRMGRMERNGEKWQK